MPLPDPPPLPALPVVPPRPPLEPPDEQALPREATTRKKQKVFMQVRAVFMRFLFRSMGGSCAARL
jgi:hypothetical protein